MEEQVQQSVETETVQNEEHISEIKNSSDVIEAHQLLAQGKRNIVCGEVHHAVLQFQQACELLSKKYGEVADECAEAYFCYGKALLEYARSDNGVLGNAINSVSSEEDANSASDDEDGADKQESSDNIQNNGETTANDCNAENNEQGEQDEADISSVQSEENSVELEDEEGQQTGAIAGDDENKENVENNAEAEEDVSNLQLAWEMLELAKVIFTRHETKEAKLKLSEIYLNLGEIGLESGQFAQAIDDFRECLHLRQELLEPADRCLAETYYQLGLACTHNASYEDALNYYRQAIEVIETKLNILAEFVKEAEKAGKGEDLVDFDDPVYKARREIEDLKSILPDIVGKMEDTQDEKKNADLVKKMLRETMSLAPSMSQADDGGCSSRSIAPASSFSSAPADSSVQNKETTNITHLVRKKRKPEDVPAAENSNKKPALENGDVVSGSVETENINKKPALENGDIASDSVTSNGHS